MRSDGSERRGGRQRRVGDDELAVLVEKGSVMMVMVVLV